MSSNHSSSYISLNPYASTSIESNIPELAERIFSVNPYPPCSIGLELDIDASSDNSNKKSNENLSNEISNENLSSEKTQTVFEILANILLCGIKIKYGEHQDPKRLNEKQIETLQAYMRSLGFTISVTTFDLREKDVIDAYDDQERETYKPTDLEYYRLRMADQELNLLHDLKIVTYRPLQTQLTSSNSRLL